MSEALYCKHGIKHSDSSDVLVLNSPRVSVLMPVFDSAKYLRESIHSVLTQSYEDFEFLIGDDCSNDSSYEIARESSVHDKRVRVFKSHENTGVAQTLNSLIGQSRGTYIVRMDADDICCTERVGVQIQEIERSGADLVFGHATLIDEEENEICRIFTPTLKECLLALPQKCFFIHPTAVIRRSVFDKYGPYNERYRHGQDWELWKRLYPSARFGMVEMVVLKYRLNSKSVTQTRLKSNQKSLDFEAAKACLRNFDRRNYQKYLRGLKNSQKLVVEFARFMRYYQFRLFWHKHRARVSIWWHGDTLTNR